MSAPALLQHAETPTGAWWVNGATSGTLAFSGNTAAGSLLLLFVKTMSNIALSSVTDTQNNTWALGTLISASGGTSVQAAWALGTVGGANTVTANFASAVAQAVGSIAEFSNIQNVRTITFLNTFESAIGSSTAPLCTIQSNVPGDLVISVCDGGTVNSHLQYAGPTDSSPNAMPYNTAIAVQAFVDNDSFAWAWGIGNMKNAHTAASWTLTNIANWGVFLFSFAPPVPAQISPSTNSDNFTRANQAPLAGNWTTWGSAAALNLTSNAVVPSSTTLICGSYWNANSFGDNHYSEVTVATVGTSGTACGPAVRMSSNGSQTNGYCGEIFSGTVMVLQKIVNGVRSNLGTAATVTTSPGDVIRLSVSGCMLTMTKNGVVIRCIYDGMFPSGGAPGIMIFQNNLAAPSTFNAWNGGQFGDSRFYQSTVFGDDDSLTSESGVFTAPNKAGSLLVCHTGYPDLSEPGAQISDTQGNTWVKFIGNFNSGTFGNDFFYCLNAKAGPNTVTTTRTAGGHLPNTVAEYVNPNGLGWTLDAITKNSSTAATVSGTLTTAQANELLIACVQINGNNATAVPAGRLINAWSGEIKLYDQPAPNAGSNTFTGTPADNNGAPVVSIAQGLVLAAFAPSQPSSVSYSQQQFRRRRSE